MQYLNIYIYIYREREREREERERERGERERETERETVKEEENICIDISLYPKYIQSLIMYMSAFLYNCIIHFSVYGNANNHILGVKTFLSEKPPSDIRIRH